MQDDGSITIRPCTLDDVPAVLRLAAADEERVTGRRSLLDLGDIRDWWADVDLAASSFLAVPDAPAADGMGEDVAHASPVGVAWLHRPGGDLGATFPIAADGDPAVLGALLDLVEGLAVDRGLARLQAAVPVPDPGLEDRLRERGYREIRHFLDMAIELQAPPPSAVVPAGLVLRQATEDDARDFHATLEEAFTDHWEHHPVSFEDWWQRRRAADDFDLTWWFLVMDGVQPAAAIRAVPHRNGGVAVPTLGVRRAWRGRGLGKALLRRVFARSWEEGFSRITLSVDATSPTGATSLYRGVGMVTERDTAVLEKALPVRDGDGSGGSDDSGGAVPPAG